MTRVDSFFFRIAAAVAFALINIMALYLLLRGHNMPGGGFIAGLAATMAMLLYGLAVGFDEVERHMPGDPFRMAAVGLLVSVASALLPLLFGKQFFDHMQGYVKIPFFGEIHLGTPLLFDIGVLLTVIGISTKIIFVVARSTSRRSALLDHELDRYAAPMETPIEDENSPPSQPTPLESPDGR